MKLNVIIEIWNEVWVKVTNYPDGVWSMGGSNKNNVNFTQVEVTVDVGFELDNIKNLHNWTINGRCMK